MLTRSRTNSSIYKKTKTYQNKTTNNQTQKTTKSNRKPKTPPQEIENSDQAGVEISFSPNSNVNNIIDEHFKLEVIERRILFGKDTVHGHPAMSVNILENEGLKDLDQSEIAIKRTYKFVKPKNVLPNFWPPRSYDKSFKKLSEKESKKIRTKITKLDKARQNGEGRFNAHASFESDFDYFDYDSDDSDESDSSDFNDYSPELPLAQKPKERTTTIRTRSTDPYVEKPLKGKLSILLSSKLFDTDGSDYDTEP